MAKRSKEQVSDFFDRGKVKTNLTPPDNEAIPVLKCFFCEEEVYEGQDYYVLNGFYCCEDCLDIHFKFTAELPDYDS